MNYNDMVADPAPIVAGINRFLVAGSTQARWHGAVEPSLYRNRD